MAKVHAKEVVHDIRAGMSDTDLMQKYEVSPQGLRILFRKLLDMKAITDAELSDRTPASDKTMAFAWHCPACGKPQVQEMAECPDCGVVVAKLPEWQARKGAAKEREAEQRDAEQKQRETEQREAEQKRARAEQKQREAEQREAEQRKARYVKQMENREDKAALTLQLQLWQEYRSTPGRLKERMYPFLTLYYIVIQGVGLIAAIGCAIAFYSAATSTYNTGAMVGAAIVLLVGCLGCFITAETVRIFVDISSSLVRINAHLSQSNAVLGQLLDRASEWHDSC